MILGIGLDLCSIARMKRAIQNPGFQVRVFSEEEIKYARKHPRPEVPFAAAFAAKEAFAKAGGWGLASVGLQGVSVTRTPRGPRLVLDPPNLERLRERGASIGLVSLTHEGEYAAAVVLLEGNDHAQDL